MLRKNALCAATALSVFAAGSAFADNHSTITVATVNNGDMIRMQGYTDQFTEATGISREGMGWPSAPGRRATISGAGAK